MLSLVLWLALIVWLGLVVWALSVVRAAAVVDAPSPSPERLAAGRVPYAGRRRAMAIRGSQEEEMVGVLSERERAQLDRLLKKLTLWAEAP